MATRQAAHRRASVFDDIENWMEQRNAEVRRLSREAERVGRDAWNQATRTGRNLAATLPKDVVALGAHVLDRRKQQPLPALQPKRSPVPARPSRTTAQASPKPAAPDVRRLAREGTNQLLAGARGAQDAFTFGLGDRLYAGALAVKDAVDGADLRRSYEARMARERARDEYDAAHYRVGRTVGQALGVGAQIVALGGLEGAVAAGSRIPQATRLIRRELAVLGAAGGAAGASSQVISDATRRRAGTPGDYLGSTLGGAVGALGSRRGFGTYAGAAEGAVTSVAKDLFNGRRPSTERALEAASAAGVMGGVGGVAGRSWSDSLSNKSKEGLGEAFSRVRTWSRGERTQAGKKSREYLPGGGYTYPDQRTFKGDTPSDLVESKFGRSAELSKRQRQAHSELSNYRVDHTRPPHVGALVGFPAAEFGAHWALGDEQRQSAGY